MADQLTNHQIARMKLMAARQAIKMIVEHNIERCFGVDLKTACTRMIEAEATIQGIEEIAAEAQAEEPREAAEDCDDSCAEHMICCDGFCTHSALHENGCVVTAR